MAKKRRSKILAWLLVCLLAAGNLPVSALAAGEWDGQAADTQPSGSGTEEEPYLLADAADLKWFADQVNAAKKSTSVLCAKLEQDIDLNGQEWTPIGCYNSYSDYTYYGGVFDGDGHRISGLMIDNDKTYQALFGYVKGGTVKNLTVAGTVKTGATSSAYAAGIVGYGNPVTVENCVNEAAVTAEKKGYAAGIAAYAGRD